MKKVIAIGMILLIVITALCSCGPKQAATIQEAAGDADSIVNNYDSKWASKANVTAEGLLRQSVGIDEYIYAYEAHIMLKQEINSNQIENMVDDLNDKLVDAFYGYEVTTIIIVFNEYGNVISSYLDGKTV